MWQLD